MKDPSTRTYMLLICAFVCLSHSQANAEGPEIRFMPIRTAPLGSPAGTVGGPVTPLFNANLGCWEVITAPGVEIDLDLQAFGWGQAEGNPALGVIQATVDSTGYDNGVGSSLNPKGWPDSASDGGYQAKFACGGPAGDGSPCVAPFDFTCGGTADTFCLHNPNWVMPPCAMDVPASAFHTLDYEWATAAQDGSCNEDDGQVKTLGGLILEVPPNAGGTYVIGFDEDPNNTLARSASAIAIPIVALTPACITVACQSDIDCDDGSTCTSDSCNIDSGRCEYELSPAGTSCGDPASNECDLPDTCDDAGRCQPSYLPAGTACGDPTSSKCTQSDTCDGNGVCQNNDAPPDTPCTDDGDICTTDHCDGGACVHTPIPGENDCNGSGTPDACEIAAGTSEDCDQDGVPDECQIDGNHIVDCSVIEGPCYEGPFYCESDCDPDVNGNGIIDACDALGPEIRFMPIRTAPLGSPAGTVGDPVTPLFNANLGCWEVITAPGVEIDLDVQGLGWGQAEGSPTLGGIQATLDSGSLSTGTGAALNPKGWPDNPLDGSYQAHSICGGLGGDGSPCVPPFDVTCGGLPDAFCLHNPDWIMPPCASDFPAYSVNSQNFGWATAAFNDCVVDAGQPKTFGGLILAVPPGARGSYIIGFDEDRNNSFMDRGSGLAIDGVVFTAACITVPCQSDADCVSGNACTVDTCNLSTGRCEFAPVPAGAVCGDPSDSDCDQPDACDGNGVCGPNHEPDGKLCADDGNDCTGDVCEAGVCTHSNLSDGTPCGDSTSTACDFPDTCDGAGVCQPNLAPPDTACGDSSSDECTQPDTCDGSGVCQGNHEPNGTRCADDGDICTTDLCDGGVCVHEPVPVVADCNGNGVSDICEIVSGVKPDCDGDGMPDECRIAADQVVDCSGFIGPCYAGPFFCASDCDPDLNGNGIIDACDCPAGAVQWLDPPTDIIDARQPHPVNAIEPAQGLREFVVYAPAGADKPGCWSLCESDVGDGGPNGVASVADQGEGTYLVTLDRPITPGATTEISFVDFNDQVTATGRFRSLPGDANSDAIVTAPGDIRALIDCLNGVVDPPCEIWQTDINRSGLANAQDILRLVDLINGAGAYEVWLTRSVPSDCP